MSKERGRGVPTPGLAHAVWRASSRSANGANCVEVAAVWRTSSRSANESACVEVATGADTIAVRDSKDRTGPALAFGSGAWRAFVAGVKSGAYDPR